MSRGVAALLLVALLAVAAGCTAFGASAAEVTVENADQTSYRMTVYVIEEPVGAGNVTFRATTDDGVRRSIGLRRLDEGQYYDVSLGEEWNATERRLTVPANETTTASFEAWEPGAAVVYVFETPDGRVVRHDFSECPGGSLRHTFVFSDGPENGYRARCPARG